jgi:hypothetical protein
MMWAEIAFGIAAIALAVLGFVAKQVSGINDEFKLLNGRFYAHLQAPGIHREGFAIMEGKIDNVDQKVNVAHKRLDAVCAKQGGK